MICLAYLSSATAGVDAASLSDILARSQRNNGRDEITGLLCHYDGSFLQFLEGEGTIVEATFQRIAADPRHQGLIEVYRQPIAARAFAGWSMGVARPDRMGAEEQAFCTNLRAVELSAAPAHGAALEPFLASFRAWMR